MNDLVFPKEPPLPSIPSQNRHSGVGDVRFTTDLSPGQKGDEEPSISGKLSNIEAQRIISVVQEVQRKVSQIGQLPDIMDNRVASVFGGDTFTLIRVIIFYLIKRITGSLSLNIKIYQNRRLELVMERFHMN